MNKPYRPYLGKRVTIEKTHPKYQRLFEDITTEGTIVDYSSGKFGGLILVELTRTKELRWFKPWHLKVVL